jgi:ribosome-binding factor A
MDYRRSDRVGDLLLEEVSELLAKEVNDPRIGTVTLTAARVSSDLKHARIFFSPLELERRKEDVLAGLKSATPFIRGKIGKRLNLRFIPTLEFVYDEAQERVQRIEQLLRQVKDEK